MGDSNPIQNSFNGGKFDALMSGRADLARYRSACREFTNFVPAVQGPAIKRSGTRFVKPCFNHTQASRLIPFKYSRDQAYVLEFGDNKIRFMRDSGAVLETAVAISVGTPPTIANPCVITTTGAHGYATGDEVFITGSRLEFLNDQFFTVTVTSATTFTLSYDGLSISSVGESLVTAGTNTVARTYQITNGVSSNAIPWNYDELDDIQYAQDADTLYLVHPSYPPHKLVRTSDTSWACTAIEFKWPAFRDENTSTTTVYASAATGTGVTITASSAVFTADMVGGYIKIGELVESKHPTWVPDSTMATYFGGGGISVGDDVTYLGRVYRLDDKNGSPSTGHNAPIHEEGIENDNSEKASSFDWKFINWGWGLAKITGFTSSTVITVDVDTYGVEFPASVVLVANATKKWAISAFCEEYGYPAAVALFERRLWMGGTDLDTHTFWGTRTNKFENFQTITGLAESGVSWTIANDQDAIQWIVAQDRLIIGTRGGEYTAESNSPDEAITPDNIKVKQRSAYGSAQSVAPILVDSALIMAHRNAKRLHEIIYDINMEKNNGPDLTAMSSSILGDGARGLAYQAVPYRQILVNTEDGNLALLTYVRDEEVLAWSDFYSETDVGASLVESVCVIPHPDGDQDQVWLVMIRAVDLGTRRWIEILEKPFYEGQELNDAYFVDAGVTYAGTATTTVNGLLHLAGQTVDVLYAGSTILVGTGTVTSQGKLSVSSTTKIHIGFAVESNLETMDFEVGQPPFATSHGRKGRVVGTVLRVHNTGAGLYYGQRLDGTLDLWAPEPEMYSDEGLLTGDSQFLELPGGYSRNQRVALSHTEPLPCTIVAIMPKITTEAN